MEVIELISLPVSPYAKAYIWMEVIEFIRLANSPYAYAHIVCVVVQAMSPGSRVISMPRLGGLHHRYDLAA